MLQHLPQPHQICDRPSSRWDGPAKKILLRIPSGLAVLVATWMEMAILDLGPNWFMASRNRVCAPEVSIHTVAYYKTLQGNVMTKSRYQFKV